MLLSGPEIGRRAEQRAQEYMTTGVPALLGIRVFLTASGRGCTSGMPAVAIVDGMINKVCEHPAYSKVDLDSSTMRCPRLPRVSAAEEPGSGESPTFQETSGRVSSGARGLKALTDGHEGIEGPGRSAICAAS